MHLGYFYVIPQSPQIFKQLVVLALRTKTASRTLPSAEYAKIFVIQETNINSLWPPIESKALYAQRSMVLSCSTHVVRIAKVAFQSLRRPVIAFLILKKAGSPRVHCARGCHEVGCPYGHTGR
jgi:hypothetical protein